MADDDKQSCENGQTKSQEDAGVLDLDFEDADTIIKAHPSNFRGRKKYTLREDLIILKNVVRTHSCFSATGTMLWQAMENRKVTDHSWESMKSRYLRYILPAIDTYDVPNQWKSLLTGDTSKDESYYTHPDIYPWSMRGIWTSPSPKKKENSNFGLFGDHPPLKKKKKSSNVDNVMEKTSNSSLRKLSDPNCSAITSSTITPSPLKSPLTNPTSTPKHNNGCSKFVNIAMNLEDQIDEYDSREMSEDILEPNKSVTASMVGGVSSESEDEFDIKLMKMTAESKTRNSVTDENNQMISFKAPDQKTKYQNSSVMGENDNVIADDSVINVLSQTEETIQCKFCLKDQNNLPEKATKADDDSAGTGINVLSQSESCSKNQNKSTETSFVIGCDDDFDKNLLKKATKSISPTCSKKLLPRRKSKSPVKRTSERHGNKGSSLRDFVANDIADMSMDESEESTIDELTKVIEEFHDKYNLSKEQVMSLLWNFSGNVKNAMQWVEFGSDLSNLQPWSKGDDSLLTSTNKTHLNYLKVKYTPEVIAERILFFEQLKL